MNILLSILVTIAIFIAWNLLMLIIKKKFPRFAIAMQVLSVIFIVAAGVFLAFLFLDARDFISNFESGKKVFVLEDGSVVKSAIIIQNNTPQILYQADIDLYSQHLAKGDLAQIKGDAYKLILMKTGSIEELPDFEIKNGPLNLSKQESLKILTDDSYAESLMKGDGTFSIYNFNSIYDLRAMILSDILSKHFFSSQGQSYTIAQLKKDNLKIYPDSLLFLSIRMMPSSWIPRPEQKI